jgi:ribosomal subunit interface protein
MNSIQVTFRDLPYSQTLENRIHEHAEKLREFFDQFIHCRVVLTISQNHKHQGKLYNVRINLAVPGKEIVVTRKQAQDIYVAIRDAFDALTRQVEDYFRRRRGEVKRHEIPLYGFIVRLFPEENYGFIKGQDGNEYYFSATNVASKTFHQLAVGDTVQFMSEAGNEGLQARRVTLERHNNHVENF